MEKDWINIYNSAKMNEIEIIKGALALQGINAVAINKKDSSYQFGEIELFVNRKEVLKALQIINNYNRQQA